MNPKIELSVKNISFSANGTEILKNISFKAEKSSAVTILGPNGAGKSTLLKCILGIYENWEGSIKIEDTEIKNFSAKKRAKKIGYVPQASDFRSADMSVEEFLRLSRYVDMSIFGNCPDFNSEQTKEAICLTEMSDYLTRRISTLSGGELQRMLICGVLIQDVRVMLLDEPVAHLDPGGRERINSIISKLVNEKEKTAVRVTHDINEAALYSDKIVCLKNGAVFQSGNPGECITADLMNKLFSGKFIDLPHPETGRTLLFPSNRNSHE
ncbi:MAG: ABC transporter ATP-binding protein [bacterium]